MIYDIIPLRMKLQDAISEWNRHEEKQNIMTILDILDSMYEQNEDLYVPGADADFSGVPGYMIVSAGGEYWMAAYTSDQAESVGNIPLTPYPLRQLFQDLMSEQGESLRGIVINPHDPFFLQREVIRISWRPEGMRKGKIYLTASCGNEESELNVEGNVVGESEYPVMLLREENHTAHMDFPSTVLDEKKAERVRNLVWDLLDAMKEREICSVTFPSKIYEDQHENKYAVGLIALAVKIYENSYEDFDIHWIFRCDEKEKDQLQEYLEELDRELGEGPSKN